MIFLLILAAGYLAWEVTNLWVAHQLAKDSPPTVEQDDDAEMGGAGKSGDRRRLAGSDGDSYRSFYRNRLAA